MKRRLFLGTTIGTAAIASGIACNKENSNRNYSNVGFERPSVTENGLLAGMTLEDLRRQYENDIFEEHFPFHNKYVVDHEYGSFIATTDHDGNHKNTNTSSSFMGRGIWCYSFLYNNLAREDKYLDTAAKVVKLIMKHQPTGDDFWPGSYNRKGEVIGSGKGNLPGDCYIAEGLAEYAKATGENRYMNLAEETILKTLRH
ncbi:MAG TPA: hypothetical protein ENH82_11095, partial [bacterium]|nr:hypothetical protein [bacterium]